MICLGVDNRSQIATAIKSSDKNQPPRVEDQKLYGKNLNRLVTIFKSIMLPGIMGSMAILKATRGKSLAEGFMGIGPKLDSPLPLFPPKSGPLGHYPTYKLLWKLEIYM